MDKVYAGNDMTSFFFFNLRGFVRTGSEQPLLKSERSHKKELKHFKHVGIMKERRK